VKYLASIMMFVFFTFSCAEELVFEESIEVYGHAYGSPRNITKGIYAPLKRHIHGIREKKAFLFNGDFVIENDSIHVSNLLNDIDSLRSQATFIRANHEFIHDNKTLEELISNRNTHFMFGLASVYLWESYENKWNLTVKQIEVIEEDDSDLIIIICPEVFWWKFIEKEKAVGNIDLTVYSRQYNSDDNKCDSSNFINKVLPVLKLKKAVILISGDAGALPYVNPYYLLKYNNITAINSGMGLNYEDNYVELNKLKSGIVKVYLRDLESKEIIEELN
jgi:hypothetical protein